VIVCGWCERPTADRTRCASCGHPDPGRPWRQRGSAPPIVRTDATGRPSLSPSAVRHRIAEARHALGSDATHAELAEYLDVSERTMRRWLKVAG
jgi:hypothetical protein